MNIRNLIVVICLTISFPLFAQQVFSPTALKVGVEGGFVLVPGVSTTGETGGSNYTLGINAELPLFNEFLSLETGLALTKFGTHTHYSIFEQLPDEVVGANTYLRADYDISYVSVPLRAKFNHKYFHVLVGVQSDFFVSMNNSEQFVKYNAQDINFKTLPQEDVRKVNTSLSFGVGAQRRFNDRLSFFVRPLVNYQMNSIHNNDELEGTRFSYQLQFGTKIHFLK